MTDINTGEEQHQQQQQMDVHMNKPQRGDVMVVGGGVDRADGGALADDERTETERSPEECGSSKRMKTVQKEEQLCLTPGVNEKDIFVDNDGIQLGEDQVVGMENNSVAGSANNKAGGGKRRNRRKGKGGKHHSGHKKWKPYSKLSWEEKRLQDERESRRATQRREQRFASGQPMAPYNTTQFLMEQHGEEGGGAERKIEGGTTANMDSNQTNHHMTTSVGVTGGSGRIGHHFNHSVSVSGEGSGSAVDSSADEHYYSSPDDEEMFLQKDFSEEYDNFHAERLQAMSKDELVREFLELEGKIEKLEEKKIGSSVGGSGAATKDSNKISSPGSKMVVGGGVVPPPPPFIVVAKLQDELHKLKAENDLLKKENDILRAGVLNNHVTFVDNDKENKPQS